jgi:hypothetical protein
LHAATATATTILAQGHTDALLAPATTVVFTPTPTFEGI